MKEKLTREENNILTYIIEYYYANKKMPLRTEIAKRVGMSSQLVQYKLRKLEKKGYIEVMPLKKGGIKLK